MRYHCLHFVYIVLENLGSVLRLFNSFDNLESTEISIRITSEINKVQIVFNLYYYLKLH